MTAETETQQQETEQQTEQQTEKETEKETQQQPTQETQQETTGNNKEASGPRTRKSIMKKVNPNDNSIRASFFQVYILWL